MTEANGTSAVAARVLELAGQEKLQDLEDSWLEMAAEPPADGEFYNQFIRAMRRARALDAAHGLLLILLDDIQKRQEWGLLLRIIEVAAPFWPDSKELRPFAAQALKGVHASHPNLGQMIGGCKGLPLDQVLVRFKSFLSMSPGEVYSHAYWGEGIVRELDLAGGKIVVDFPGEQGKSMPLDFFRKHLVHLAPESFLARRAKAPEGLRELGEEDPAGLVRLAVRGAGGSLKQSNLKELIIRGVIDEGDWPSWWNRARNELRVDPMVDFDTRRGAHAEIVLRDKPRSVEEDVENLFFGPDATLATRIAAVAKLGEAQKAAVALDSQLAARLAVAIADGLRSETSDPGGNIQKRCLYDDLAALDPGILEEAGPVPPMELFLKAIEDYESLNGVEHTDYAVRALHALVARDGEQGIVRAAEYLPVAPARLAQAIWKELDPEHHIQLAVRALRTLFEYPLENPETYLWTVRSITEGKWAHLEDFIPLSSLVVDLFDGLDRWQQVCDRGSAEAETLTRAKWLVGKVRAILHARNFAAICAAAESMTLEQAQDLRRTIQLHPALPEAFRNGADHQLRLTRRDLEGTTTAPPPSADSGIHYCTMLAHSRAVHDLHELNTVKIPQNAREIEKARSEGDLRENAGYHGAREKHVLLLQQAHFLQQGLVRARIMTADKISVAAVGFGVNFDAENLTTGTRETYKVLGQWESDPEQGIYSYQAPFLQNFVGRKAGEEFTVRMPDGTESRYRICEISNALESGDWDKAAEYTV